MIVKFAICKLNRDACQDTKHVHLIWALQNSEKNHSYYLCHLWHFDMAEPESRCRYFLPSSYRGRQLSDSEHLPHKHEDQDSDTKNKMAMVLPTLIIL